MPDRPGEERRAFLRRSFAEAASTALDAAGAVTRVEHWRDDVKHGRSCTWKDGAVEADQLYRLGTVAR